jgi:hypothetical protein
MLAVTAITKKQFGQPAYITDRMRQDFLGGGGYGGSREIPDQLGSLLETNG